MSKLIPDRDIRELIGNVLIDADENCLNPNGIELRLGRHVYFHSSDEEFKLEPEQFLVVRGPVRMLLFQALRKSISLKQLFSNTFLIAC